MYTGPPLWQAAWPAYVIKCRSKVPLVWGKLADVIMQSHLLSPHFEFVESIKTTVVDEVRRSRWYFSWVFYCTALSVQCLSTNCHVWKTFAVRFHVTSQVTNQTGCVKEEEKHLSSPSEALMLEAFAAVMCLSGNHVTLTLCHSYQTFFFYCTK